MGALVDRPRTFRSKDVQDQAGWPRAGATHELPFRPGAQVEEPDATCEEFGQHLLGRQ